MLSVIIPVYNNWHLTRQCLASLAETTANEDLEVLVVDNASSDETSRACPPFLDALFPGRSRYIQEEVNRNFSGAINRGASQAQGEYLFLLNNDTILLSNWLPPLLETMRSEPNLGAIGPLLLYPGPEGERRVQHLGVTFSLNLQVSHLYECFPENHDLVLGKRRAFQVITAAAFFIPRERFLSLGGLDERFVNGFEDVEFCHRLVRAGYMQTVVPASKIVHMSKQSVGRMEHDANNSSLCSQLCTDFRFDKARFLREDGYRPLVSPWLKNDRCVIEPLLPAKKEAFLRRSLAEGNRSALIPLVHDEPYWIAGALIAARMCASASCLKDAFALYQQACSFCITPVLLIPFAEFCLQYDHASLGTIRSALEMYVTDEKRRLSQLYAVYKRFLSCGEDVLAKQTMALIKSNDRFFAEEYPSLTDCIQKIQTIEQVNRTDFAVLRFTENTTPCGV